jgi:hypothetical protein
MGNTTMVADPGDWLAIVLLATGDEDYLAAQRLRADDPAAGRLEGLSGGLW